MEGVVISNVLSRPPDEIRKLVETSFVSAKKLLQERRRDVVLRNVFQCVEQAKKDCEDFLTSCENLPASRSLNCINQNRVLLERVRRAPNSVSWIRVSTNLKTPEVFKDRFFVPYIGETDAQQKFSNTLAADADSSVLEQYPEDDLSDVEYRIYNPPAADLISSSHGQKPNQSKSKRSTSQRTKYLSSKEKSAEKVWARAVNRRALEDVLKKLRLDSTSSIADVVSDVFGMRSVSQVSSCHRNVLYRRTMYKKEANEATLRRNQRNWLLRLVHGEEIPTPHAALQGDSIPFFFCRQCYVYNCLEHGNQTATPSVIPQDRSRKDTTTKQSSEEIASACSDKNSGDCWCRSQDSSGGEIWWKNLQRSRGIADDVKSLLLELFTSFGNDPCRIVCLMRILLSDLNMAEKLTCNKIGYILNSLEEFSCSLYKGHSQTKRLGRRQPKKSYRSKAPRAETDSMNKGRRVDYAPCQHDGPCTLKTCRCVENGVNCEKYCSCNHKRSHSGRSERRLSCRNAFQGCTCKSEEACVSNACICFSYGRECDPDLCRACHECKLGENQRSCRNTGLLMGERQRTVVGHSSTHGWGAFAASNISKGDIIGEYVGEIVSHSDADRRGRLYDEIDYSFLFNITENWALDSTRLGNKLRYCNHHFSPNCTAKLMRVGGDVRVGLYALRDIRANEELFFDYKYKNGPSWSMPGRDETRPKTQRGSAKKRAIVEEDDEYEVMPALKRRRAGCSSSKRMLSPLLVTHNGKSRVLRGSSNGTATVVKQVINTKKISAHEMEGNSLRVPPRNDDDWRNTVDEAWPPGNLDSPSPHGRGNHVSKTRQDVLSSSQVLLRTRSFGKLLSPEEAVSGGSLSLKEVTVPPSTSDDDVVGESSGDHRNAIRIDVPSTNGLRELLGSDYKYDEDGAVK